MQPDGERLAKARLGHSLLHLALSCHYAQNPRLAGVFAQIVWLSICLRSLIGAYKAYRGIAESEDSGIPHTLVSTGESIGERHLFPGRSAVIALWGQAARHIGYCPRWSDLDIIVV